ncbi:TniQ family protein [Desulfotomaculum sp. 1211_IL3151]|uniref:TniQ family protein n=1 Tax=Desulfotomaculum sp. 1211_IL3151 TaxID=3084055 RepID=UPI002FDA724E
MLIIKAGFFASLYYILLLVQLAVGGIDNNMTKLLVRLHPHPNESLISFCYRLGEVNFSDPKDIISTIKGGFEVSIFEKEKLLNHLAILLEIGETELEKLSIRNFINRNLSVKILSQDKQIKEYLCLNSIKFCPFCLKEDHYLPINWFLRPCAVCLKHRVYLIDTCTNCNRKLSLTEVMSGLCRCGQDIITIKTTEVKNKKVFMIQEVINMGLQNGCIDKKFYKQKDSPFSKISFSELLWFMTKFTDLLLNYPTPSFSISFNRKKGHNIIRAKTETQKYKKNILSQKDIAAIYAKSFNIIENWPKYFSRYLEEGSDHYRDNFVEVLNFIYRNLNLLPYEFVIKDFQNCHNEIMLRNLRWIWQRYDDFGNRIYDTYQEEFIPYKGKGLYCRTLKIKKQNTRNYDRFKIYY